MALVRVSRSTAWDAVWQEVRGRERPRDVGFALFAARWQAARVVAPKTAALEAMLLRVHVLPAFTGWTVREVLRAEILQHYVAALGQRAGAATTRRTWILLQRLCRDARRWGYVRTNPAPEVDAPRGRPGRGAAFSVEELAALLGMVRRPWQELVLTAALTGLRWGELVALEAGDVELEADRLHVRRQRPAGLGWTTPPKSRAALRTVDLLPPVRAILEGRMRRCDESAQARTQARRLLFPGARGGPLNHRWAARAWWGPALVAAGLEGRHWHWLRHTTASLLLAWGEPVLYVAQQLGHARPSITLDVYGHLLGRRVDRAATLAILAHAAGVGGAAS